jgi:NTP pyrophosphatase (non-canonical NTP hydrolase)
MDFSSYQLASRATAIYPRRYAIEYLSLGLASEAGEVAGKIAKIYRDKQGDFTAETIAAIGSEMGDTLWMISQLATELGLDLNDIAQGNLDKLRDRQVRGVLGGSGDQR